MAILKTLLSILKKSVLQCLYISLLACSAILLSAQTPPTREYQIKAGFLFNFTQFIEWPASAFLKAETPIVIGVLGENPFSSYLDEIVSGEVVNGHPLVVQHYNNVEEIKTCHILFINVADTDKLERIVDRVSPRRAVLRHVSQSLVPAGRSRWVRRIAGLGRGLRSARWLAGKNSDRSSQLYGVPPR